MTWDFDRPSRLAVWLRLNQPSGASPPESLRRPSWVSRICHGAPGVICRPAKIPSRSQRWIVLLVTPSWAADSSAVGSVLEVFGLLCGAFWDLMTPSEREHIGLSERIP